MASVIVGILGLGLLLPGYSQVDQTVSEIGEIGSPMRIPFAILLCPVAGWLVGFALGIQARCVACLIGCMALSSAGVGIFAFPHPLHNRFGESELLGYQAPGIGDCLARPFFGPRPVAFSGVMVAVIWTSLGFNLTALDRHSALWTSIRPFYGLLQRSLFVVWFGWCAGAGLMLWRGRGLSPNVRDLGSRKRAQE